MSWRTSSTSSLGRVRRVSLVLIATILVVAMMSGTANAYLSHSFCAYVYPSGQVCSEPDPNAHTWTYEQADYEGGGTLEYTCQYMDNSTQGTRSGSTCAHDANFTSHNYGATSYYWHARVYFFSYNGASHTVPGLASLP